jgi:hypothetical protein
MPNNNDVINRPFADLQERLAEVERLERDDTPTTRKEVDYRAIANFLSNEMYHLITTTSDPEVKAWGRQRLGADDYCLNWLINTQTYFKSSRAG